MNMMMLMMIKPNIHALLLQVLVLIGLTGIFVHTVAAADSDSRLVYSRESDMILVDDSDYSYEKHVVVNIDRREEIQAPMNLNFYIMNQGGVEGQEGTRVHTRTGTRSDLNFYIYNQPDFNNENQGGDGQGTTSTSTSKGMGRNGNINMEFTSSVDLHFYIRDQPSFNRGNQGDTGQGVTKRGHDSSKMIMNMEDSRIILNFHIYNQRNFDGNPEEIGKGAKRSQNGNYMNVEELPINFNFHIYEQSPGDAGQDGTNRDSHINMNMNMNGRSHQQGSERGYIRGKGSTSSVDRGSSGTLHEGKHTPNSYHYGHGAKNEATANKKVRKAKNSAGGDVSGGGNSSIAGSSRGNGGRNSSDDDGTSGDDDGSIGDDIVRDIDDGIDDVVGDDGEDGDDSYMDGDKNSKPVLNFDITNCATYSEYWLCDLALTCDEDNNNPSHCECTSAAELMSQGNLSCPDGDNYPYCPPGCSVCETCLTLLGCPMTGPTNIHIDPA